MLNNNKNISEITAAVTHLKAGNLVAFPTETVYGLGADANNPAAIQKVFTAKGRPSDHPVIVHIAQAQQLNTWACDIPEAAWQLAEHFWPGPLTLILYKQPDVSPLITGNQNTIGLRIPNHPLTLELLQKFGSGVVGPSANKYGHVSPTTAEHVIADLGTEVAAILDGGRCAVGIESTIIDLTAQQPIIMRTGAISATEISKVLGQEIKINNQVNNNVRTPGNHVSHYAPRTPVQLLSNAAMLATIADYARQDKKFSVITFQTQTTDLKVDCFWQQVSNDPVQYAHDLYANLRTHDQLNNMTIFIETPPQTADWIAILDRLTRASQNT